MIPTKHLLKRGKERFPDLDLNAQYEAARFRLSKNEMKSMREKTSDPKALEKISRHYKGVYFRKTKSGICFVIAQKEVVITAFVVNPHMFEVERIKAERRAAKESNSIYEMTERWKARVEATRS